MEEQAAVLEGLLKYVEICCDESMMGDVQPQSWIPTMGWDMMGLIRFDGKDMSAR